jgi:uncharacterized protein
MLVPWLDTALRVVILIGLLMAWGGTIIPIFPGPTVMWVFVLVYGLAAGFGTRGAIFFGVISVLTIVSWFTDNFFSLRGAHQGGAAWSTVAIAWVVGLVASFFTTPIGGILLTLLAVFLVELYRRRDAGEAWRATKQMLIGWGWSTVARLGIGFVVIVLWGLWAWL